MSRMKLTTGDRCYIKSPTGRRLGGVIADFLPMTIRGAAGDECLYPFQRNGRKKVTWMPRKLIRKLPATFLGEPLGNKPAKPTKRKQVISRVAQAMKADTMTIHEASAIINYCFAHGWNWPTEKEMATIMSKL